MIKTVAILAATFLVVLVGTVLAYAATKPDDFGVRRAAKVNAPPERIFAFINDFREWAAWSPYEKLDPSMKRTLSGAGAGAGAVYEWKGNGKVGEGRMEILQSSPSAVVIKLDFLRPFEEHNVAEFTLEPAGDTTNVTWAMKGPSPYIAKVMSVFVDMDKMIGRDFETGLANLKALAEK